MIFNLGNIRVHNQINRKKKRKEKVPTVANGSRSWALLAMDSQGKNNADDQNKGSSFQRLVRSPRICHCTCIVGFFLR